MSKLTYKSFSLGFTFEKHKEVISLIFITYFLIILFSAILVLLHTSGEELILVSYRYHLMLFLLLINPLLIKYKIYFIPKFIVLFCLPFILVLAPPLAGLFDNEFYFWFPYVPIGLSIIPHFILKPIKERFLLFFTLGFYFAIILLIDNVMIKLSAHSDTMIPFVEQHRFYYNLIPVIIFIFVNIALSLLFNQNNRYERQLHSQKEELENRNNELDATLKQLHETHSQLIQSEKLASIGVLSSGIAHEINNPLNFIAVSLDQIKTSMDDNNNKSLQESEDFKALKKTLAKLLAYAEEGVDRASNIVRKLGTLKKASTQKMSNANLRKIVQSAYEFLSSSERKKIEFNNTIHKDVQLNCQERSIQKLILNILINALEARTGKEEKLKINISGNMDLIDNKTYYSFFISNNGQAIPQEHLSSIFDPFFTTKQDIEAVGLGLSEAYSIATSHKGSISAVNTIEGVLFKVSIPWEIN